MAGRGVAIGQDLAADAGMAWARAVLPNRVLMFSRRVLERRFLLRPDPITNQIIWYCLALAARHAGVKLLLPSFLSNHHHTLAYDPDGRSAEFTEYLHRLIARAVNAHRGRWENLWAAEQGCVVELTDREALLDKLVYAATNPVKDGLVAHVADWPGVNGLDALLNRRTITVQRPEVFFDPDGDLPDEVAIELTIPEELGDRDETLDELRRRVARVEEEAAAARAAEQREVLGRRRILRQHWNDQPASHAPRRGLRPQYAGSRWARFEAILRRRVFRDAYKTARALWCAGLPATFPPGTYWLRRFANVVVAPFAATDTGPFVLA